MNTEIPERDGPDYFDLSDWLLLKYPEVYSAIRYLHVGTFVQCALAIWHRDQEAR